MFNLSRTDLKDGTVLEQLDFAASLSVLLGLPTPFSSLGMVHPGFVPPGL
jgi:hypothetical protein